MHRYALVWLIYGSSMDQLGLKLLEVDGVLQWMLPHVPIILSFKKPQLEYMVDLIKELVNDRKCQEHFDKNHAVFAAKEYQCAYRN